MNLSGCSYQLQKLLDLFRSIKVVCLDITRIDTPCRILAPRQSEPNIIGIRSLAYELTTEQMQ